MITVYHQRTSCFANYIIYVGKLLFSTFIDVRFFICFTCAIKIKYKASKIDEEKTFNIIILGLIV